MRNQLSVILDLNEAHCHTLGQLTVDRPLGSVPFGGKFRLVDFPLSAASHAGVTKTMMAMPDRCQSILDHVRTGREWQNGSLGRWFIYDISVRSWFIKGHPSLY